MIRFLLKGVLRDRSRSLFPLLVVIAGVMLTVVLYSWMMGFEIDIIRANASFRSGHLIVMSKAYADNFDQMPNDLAYIGTNKLLSELREKFPDVLWSPRIRFAGLIDVPDSSGETIAQGPIIALGADLLSRESSEIEILNLNQAIVAGKLPTQSNEMIITDELAKRLKIHIGRKVTIITTSMHGSLTTFNLTVSGTIRFGVSALDRGLMFADIEDVRRGLDMMDASGEIVGFFKDGQYPAEEANRITELFTTTTNNDHSDKFSPTMMTLMEHSGLKSTLKMYRLVSGALVTIFVTAMSIVLWNAGLLGSIRRYGEFGVRLAIGETKSHLYWFLIAESTLIGFIGSVIGTLFGLLLSWYLQEYGIDISSTMKNASIVMSDVLRTQITPTSFIIGFIPGFAATILGSAISGFGIYRRQTSQLTKEFEA